MNLLHACKPRARRALLPGSPLVHTVKTKPRLTSAWVRWLPPQPKGASAPEAQLLTPPRKDLVIYAPAMHTKLLIDAIVQQTTILIARLSTAAGVRAPLAHVADQVFLNLAKEIEAQGVGRKVVADMFGLAIRTYQKKVQRLAESETDAGTTLWQAVLAFIGETPGQTVSRRRLLDRFSRDPERELLAVLTDLANSGFIYCTGKGLEARYGLTSDSDRAALLAADELDSVAQVMWLEVQKHEPLERAVLLTRFAKYENVAESALAQLLSDGRVVATGTLLESRNFVVPLGAEQGWEAAILDHYQTLVRALSVKLDQGRPTSHSADRIGGSTLHFSVYPGHPFEAQVLDLLRTVRDIALPLWQDVSEYNQAHPLPREVSRVAFYCGQLVEEHGEDDDDHASTARDKNPLAESAKTEAS